MKLSRLESMTVKSDDTAATTEPKFTVSYTETRYPSGDKVPGSNRGSLTGATAVEMVPAPEADYSECNIESISVYNADTVSRTIAIRKVYDSVNYEVVAMAVPSGRSLIYDGNKFTESYEESSGDSRATSNSVVESTNLSAGTSRATSNSVVASTNLLTGDSKATSLSVLTSTADSKGASAGTGASTADSKAVSNSVVVSSNLVTSDSKAASNSVIASSNLATGDSKAASLSVLVSSAESRISSYHA